MISRVKQALKKFSDDAAGNLTDKLRQSALAHGWDKDVVAHLTVEHSNNSFNVHVHPDYQDRAFVHEYGSETQRPTAVIRKFSNRKAEIQAAIAGNLDQHYRGTK